VGGVSGKQSGLGQKVFVDGYDISGDIQSYAIGNPRPPIEDTGVDKYGIERLYGRRDGSIEAVTYFNPGSFDPNTAGKTGSHRLLRSLPLTDRLVTVADTQSGAAWSVVAMQGNYDPTLAADGTLTTQVQAMANGYGVEAGDLLTPLGTVTHTGASQTTAVDFAAGSAFGAQAYLQVIGFTGTDCTIAIQSSSDNGVGDAFSNVTGLVFTTVTASPTTQRMQTARNASIERYLRVATTTSGGFSSITFMVMVVKNEETVNF
jgi:hypothetical protein